MEPLNSNLSPKQTQYFKETALRLANEEVENSRHKTHEAEKEKRILAMIKDHPDWRDEQIADMFEARPTLVEKMRRQFLAPPK